MQVCRQNGFYLSSVIQNAVLQSCRLGMLLYMMQSSANNLNLDFTALGRPLMLVRNRMGPNTVPCGTSDSIMTQF